MRDKNNRSHGADTDIPAHYSIPSQSQPTVSPNLSMKRGHFSRRDFLKFSGLAAAGLVMAACAPRSTSLEQLGSKAIQLVYQDWRTDWFPGLAQTMLQKFSESHPNIQVFYTPDPEHMVEQMEADFESGRAPDVLAGCCDFFPAWGQKNYLLDLRPFIEADLPAEVVKDWSVAQYHALARPDGYQFGLPKYHGALALFYNKNLFDQFKVDYPDRSWNHDDYLEAMRRTTKNGGDQKIWGSMLDVSWERLQMHVNGWGGHFVDPRDNTRSRMGDRETLEALEWIRRCMWDERVMATSLDINNLETRQAFMRGMLSMVEEGSWALKDILENANFRVGVTTFPAGPVRKVTLATIDGFAIYAGTRYPEASWELLKFLVSQDYGRAMARTHLLQPARASLVEEWVSMIQEQYPQQTLEMDLAAFADGHIQGYSVSAEIFANQSEARRLSQSAWQRIFDLGEAPVEIMKEVSQTIEAAQQKVSSQ